VVDIMNKLTPKQEDKKKKVHILPTKDVRVAYGPKEKGVFIINGKTNKI